MGHAMIDSRRSFRFLSSLPFSLLPNHQFK